MSRYFFEVAKRVCGLNGFEVRVLCPFYVNNYLQEDSPVDVWGWRVPKVPRTGRITLGVNEALVRWKLSRQPPALVHETYYAKSKLASGKTRTVITIHDMIYEKFPQFFSPGDPTHQLKKAAIDHADHIICVSENTRTDLVNILGVRPERTSVIHLSHTELPGAQGAVPSLTERPYLAYVGPRAIYKNFSGLLRSFGISEFLRNNFSIVCFGGGPLSSAEREEIAQSGLHSGQVIQISGTDESLSRVYGGASALVYPSLYEGFGLPPLEAMSARCPVIASNTGSIPEVCADAAEYFDPYQPESIARAIENVVRSETRKQQLVHAGLRQIQKYSWDKCALGTAAVYREVVQA